MFAHDFPLLCEQEGLPTVAVRSLPGTDDQSSCKVTSSLKFERPQHTAEEGGGATLAARYAVLAEYGTSQELRGLHIRGECSRLHIPWGGFGQETRNECSGSV